MTIALYHHNSSNHRSQRFVLLALIALLTTGACTQASDSTQAAAPEPSSTATQPATTASSIPLTSLAELDLLGAATRDWSTLLATTLDVSLWIENPVIGPEGLPTAATASVTRSQLWTYLDGSWGVAKNIELADQYVMEASDEALPSTFGLDMIVADGMGSDLRFLIPTAYANGPAVAAIGHDGVTWILLSFVDQNGEWSHAADAEIRDGEIVVWHNSCLLGCANTVAVPLGVSRTSRGYAVDDPPPTPPAPVPGEECEPGSFVDCVDQYGDEHWRYIEGWSQCVANYGDSGPCADLDEDGYAGYPDSG